MTKPPFGQRLREGIAWSLALAAGAGVFWLSQTRVDEGLVKASTGLQRGLLSLLRTPGTKVVPLASVAGSLLTSERLGAGGGVAAIVNARAARAMVVASGLPAAAGRDYQLWTMRGNDPTPAGLFRADALTGEAIVEVPAAALAGAPPDALAVTLEPKGGSAKPTTPVLLAADLRS